MEDATGAEIVLPEDSCLVPRNAKLGVGTGLARRARERAAAGGTGAGRLSRGGSLRRDADFFFGVRAAVAFLPVRRGVLEERFFDMWVKSRECVHICSKIRRPASGSGSRCGHVNLPHQLRSPRAGCRDRSGWASISGLATSTDSWEARSCEGRDVNQPAKPGHPKMGSCYILSPKGPLA